MGAALVLISGFGPYFRSQLNPSGLAALDLERAAPAGLRVRAAVLPVSFAGCGPALDALIARAAGERPALLLGLGMHSEAEFRVECRAGAQMRSSSLDNEGVAGRGLALGGPAERRTRVDAERARAALEAAGASALRSEDPGGFVCEALYYQLLARSESLGWPGLFVHVPHIERVPAARQIEILRAALPGFVEAAAGV